MQVVDLGTLTMETSLLILCILLVRSLFGERLHPLVLKGLWALAAIRILLPVQFPIRQKVWSVEKWLLEHNPISNSLFTGIWVVGMFFCMVMFCFKNLRFIYTLRRNREIYGRKDGILVYFFS